MWFFIKFVVLKSSDTTDFHVRSKPSIDLVITGNSIRGKLARIISFGLGSTFTTNRSHTVNSPKVHFS